MRRSGSKNFLGDVQQSGFPIQPLEADLTITVGVGGEPATINGCLAKYSRMYPAYVVGGAIFTLHLPAGFVMAEQVLVNAIDLSHWQITGADAETVITRSALTTEFETRYPVFGATTGGRLPLIGQLFDMDTSGTATNRDGLYVYGAGSIANVSVDCGVKNAGADGLSAVEVATINANGANVSGAGVNGMWAYRASTINANGANVSGAGNSGITADHCSTINANGANARMGETDATTDFRVREVSILNATGGTGGVSQTAGTYTNNGIIKK